MKTNIILKNLHVMLPAGFLLMESIGITNLNLLEKDYLMLFIVGFLGVLVQKSHTENKVNLIMSLVLKHSLTQKNILDNEDIFLSQNYLIGETPISDLGVIKNNLKENDVYLNEYLTEEDILNNREFIQNHDISIFKSFSGINDKFKEDAVFKVVSEDNHSLDN